MRHFYTAFALISAFILTSCQMSETGAKILESSKSVAGQVGGTIGSKGSDIGAMFSKTFTFDSPNAKGITNSDITTAFKQALSIGTNEVVGQLGKYNGFYLDQKVKIPLPDKLAKAQNLLNKVGMSYLMDDLQMRMNRAAEIATPHAKELFLSAISEMSFNDVMSIYNGPQNSATQFFEAKTSDKLADKMRPFIERAVADAGVVQSYDRLIAQYNSIHLASSLAPDIKSDLTTYVVDKGIDGIFYYIGEQEKQIRQDPVRQTTAILKKVFGNQN